MTGDLVEFDCADSGESVGFGDIATRLRPAAEAETCLPI